MNTAAQIAQLEESNRKLSEQVRLLLHINSNYKPPESIKEGELTETQVKELIEWLGIVSRSTPGLYGLLLYRIKEKYRQLSNI